MLTLSKIGSAKTICTSPAAPKNNDQIAFINAKHDSGIFGFPKSSLLKFRSSRHS